MPEKHVHFSPTDTVWHSPPKAKPSLTHSSSYSFTSTSRVLPESSHYSLPPSTSHSTHPLLQLSNNPAITFDMIKSPLHVSSRHGPISSDIFSESAFTPGVYKLTLISPYLPWTIIISNSNRTRITIREVLEGIHTALRKNVTSAEYNALPTVEDKHRAKRAYERRYRRLRSSRAYDEEKRQGIKCIDFMMGKTHFMGLSRTQYGPDCWTLKFA